MRENIRMHTHMGVLPLENENLEVPVLCAHRNTKLEIKNFSKLASYFSTDNR